MYKDVYIMITTTVSTIIAELAKSIVTATVNKAIDSWGQSKVAYEKELGISIEKYLNYAYEKNSTIKTLIYKNVAKPLKDFYEPLYIQSQGKSYATIDIETLINSTSDHIIITGIGGMGKSTLMRYLYLNCIDEKYAMPILIELRDFEKKIKMQPNYKLIDYIYDYISLYQFNSSKDIFIHALSSGKILLLLDGFDELEYKTAGHLENEIRDFSIKYDSCKIILSSRPSEEFQNWHLFVETNIKKLTKEQSISLIKKLDLEDQILKSSFISILDSNLYRQYTDFASIPLLLTIMLITYKDNASIPKNLHDFYDKAFNTLFYQHDAQKGSYQREIKCKLNREEFKDVLNFLAFNSYFKKDFSFTEEEILQYISNSLSKTYHSTVDPISYLRDLEKSVCMIIKEGLKYKFIHRSFQEYFAAIYLTKQNDDIQSKAFELLIENTKSIIFSENTFLNTLKYSQPTRYEENFIYNIGKEFKNLKLNEFFILIYSELEIKSPPDKTPVVATVNHTKLFMIFREYRRIYKTNNYTEFNKDVYYKLKETQYFKKDDINRFTLKLNEIEHEEVILDILNIIEPIYNIIEFKNWLINYSNEKNNDISNLLGLI